MRKHSHYFAALLFALILTSTLACHRKVVVTDVPPGISVASVQNWYTAVGIYKELGEYTNQLTTGVIQLKADFPTQESYDKTLTALGRASQVGVQTGTFLQSVPNTWSDSTSQRVASASQQISDQVNMAVTDGLAGVKNSTTKQALLTTVASINLAVKTAIALNAPSNASTTTTGGK